VNFSSYFVPRRTWCGQIDTGVLGELGVLDFAGGMSVHICSSATATATAMGLYLSYPLFRSRKSSTRTPSHLALHRPENTMCQLLAPVIIWNSWLAFDAGIMLSLNFKSVMAMCVTNLCASAGAMTWASMTYSKTGNGRSIQPSWATGLDHSVSRLHRSHNFIPLWCWRRSHMPPGFAIQIH
jgi:ammonia channel protein AmtB